MSDSSIIRVIYFNHNDGHHDDGVINLIQVLVVVVVVVVSQFKLD